MRSERIGGCAWLADTTTWPCCLPIVSYNPHALTYAAMTARDGFRSDRMRGVETKRSMCLGRSALSRNV